MRSLEPFYFERQDNCLYVLNQKILPLKIEYVRCVTCEDVVKSIKDMTVRGAPVIGLVAGYGFVLGIKEFFDHYAKRLSEDQINKKKFFLKYISDLESKLVSTRPTAVNLSWTVNKIKSFLITKLNSTNISRKIITLVLAEMKNIHQEIISQNLKISKLGYKLISKQKDKCVILTHCNAGTLATGGVGTALGIITELHRHKKIKTVYVTETRPYMQGARLTMFELISQGVPCELICDNMAGFVMKNKQVDCVIVGADRIAKNGDTANKIGTYSLSILAKYHNIPFYVAAPSSTIDTSISDGDKIVIEERSEEELKIVNGKLITLKNAKVYHPAFDITPAKLISAIITEKKVYRYPYKF